MDCRGLFELPVFSIWVQIWQLGRTGQYTPRTAIVWYGPFSRYESHMRFRFDCDRNGFNVIELDFVFGRSST